MGKGLIKGILLFSLLFVMLYVASACNETWIANYGMCGYSDTRLLAYFDNESCGTYVLLPANDGTQQPCNYCSESLIPQYSNCTMGFWNVTYTDANYYTCCSLTNLASDCDIYFPPYNTTQEESCFVGNLAQELGNLSCQSQPNIGSFTNTKVYCIAHIPLNYSNESFKCIASIVDTATNEIIQTTPDYVPNAQPLINIFPNQDTRLFFSPANSIVNFYYTGKNLLPDMYYKLQIECVSATTDLKSEMVLQRSYEDLQFVFFRTKWLMANAPYIIGGGILLFILLLVIIGLIRGVSR